MGRALSNAGRTTRNWKGGALGAALAVALGLFQPLAPWLADLSYDLPFGARAGIATTNAVIIYMDKASSDALGQPWESGAWNRQVHARLLRRLTEAHARAVVFDILFDKTTTNDAALIAAITAATNAGTLVLVGGTTEPVSKTDKASGTATLAPFEALEAIVPWGMAEKGGEDQILRRHYTGAEDRGTWVPSLSWRAAELTTTNGLSGSPKDSRWINYLGPPQWIESRSFLDALDPALVPASVFSNKVCFIGALPDPTPFAGPAQADLWRTPYSQWGYARMPGVEIIATVYLNLVRGDWLRQMPVRWEFLLVLSTGLLFGWGLTLLRPLAAAGLGIAGMFLIAALAARLAATQQVWFSWLVVAAVQIPVAAGWSVLTRSRQLARDKSALEGELAAAQTALQDAALSELPTLIDPTTLVEQVKAAAGLSANIPGARSDGTPGIPDHELVRRVGKGAYGEVWLARNAIGTYHAVKIIKRENFQSEDPFEREFRGIQKFMPISRSHPGFVQLLHVGRNQQLGYI